MIPLDRQLAALLAILFAIWVLFVVLSGLGWNPFAADWDFTNSGAFGDSFGPLSALMASVAAVSAIATYRAQNAELERVRQREAANDKAAEKAEFERTFFQLLDHHRQTVGSIDLEGSGSQRVGQDAFRSMLFMLKNNISAGLPATWNKTYDKYKNDLGHYFRFLYHIVKFVDNSSVENKYFYIQILRATLSESELVLIGANCCYGEGVDKFKELVERYALLHNLSEEARRTYLFNEMFAAGAFERATLSDRSR